MELRQTHGDRRLSFLQPHWTVLALQATNWLLVHPLSHARPARGVGVTPGGTPVAGAAIRPVLTQTPHAAHQYGTREPVLSATDEAGRCTLDTLHDDATDVMLVEVKGQGRRRLPDVRAGQEGLRWP